MKTLPALALAALCLHAKAQDKQTLQSFLPPAVTTINLHAAHTAFMAAAPYGPEELRQMAGDRVRHTQLAASEVNPVLARLQQVRVRDVQRAEGGGKACLEKSNPLTLWELGTADGKRITIAHDHPAPAPEGSEDARLCLDDGEHAYRMEADTEGLWQAAYAAQKTSLTFGIKPLFTLANCTNRCPKASIDYAQTSNREINHVLNRLINDKLNNEYGANIPPIGIAAILGPLEGDSEKNIRPSYQGSIQTRGHLLHRFTIAHNGYNEGAPRAYDFTDLVTISETGKYLSLADILREEKHSAFAVLLAELPAEESEGAQHTIRKCFATVALTEIGFHLGNDGMHIDYSFCYSFGNVENPNTDLHIPANRLRDILKEEYLPK